VLVGVASLMRGPAFSGLANLRLTTQSPSFPGARPNPEPLGTLMPGPAEMRWRDFPAETSADACGAVLRFTDAAGVRWERRPDGYLSEVGP
jgi:hypothetical protein